MKTLFDLFKKKKPLTIQLGNIDGYVLVATKCQKLGWAFSWVDSYPSDELISKAKNAFVAQTPSYHEEETRWTRPHFLSPVKHSYNTEIQDGRITVNTEKIDGIGSVKTFKIARHPSMGMCMLRADLLENDIVLYAIMLNTIRHNGNPSSTWVPSSSTPLGVEFGNLFCLVNTEWNIPQESSNSKGPCFELVPSNAGHCH